MQLVVDVDTGLFTSPSGGAISKIAFSRGFFGEFALLFRRKNALIELPSATNELEVLMVAKFGGDTLASSATWVKAGSGPGTSYIVSLDLRTAVLEGNADVEPPVVGKFAAVDDVEPPTVAGLFQVRWRVPGQRPLSATIPLAINNSAFRGPMVTPTPAAPEYPSPSRLLVMVDSVGEVGPGTFCISEDGFYLWSAERGAVARVELAYPEIQ